MCELVVAVFEDGNRNKQHGLLVRKEGEEDVEILMTSTTEVIGQHQVLAEGDAIREKQLHEIMAQQLNKHVKAPAGSCKKAVNTITMQDHPNPLNPIMSRGQS